MRFRVLAWPLAAPLSSAALLALAAQAQSSGVAGYWREPGGSVLRVHPCGTDVCMQVMTLRPNTPHFDTHDPDPAKRSQPLCGLEIGSGFHPQGDTKAVEGHIYDPQSGHTYHGEMYSTGDVLHLRGYILFPMLGRTEKWQRVAPLPEPCHDH